MNKLTVIFSLFLLGTALSVNAQEMTQTTQSWSGYLKPTAKDSLKIVVNLQFENETLTSVTLDSPDQMAFNLKATRFSMKNDTLQFSISNLGASFMGNKEGEELISGTFTQSGKKIPLNLLPAQPILPPYRPQTPQPPFPYLEEEINMNDHNGEPNIKGTLSLPEDGKIKATLILITGSGWQDRDETILDHKPFKVIADFLTRNGYAVYRYDDLPAKVFAKSTTLDFEKDVQTIVKYFQQDKRTKNQPIGLLGHSEGGLITFLAAANNPSINFIISLAGNSEKMNDVLVYQIGESYRIAEYGEQEIKEILEMHKNVNQLLEKSKDTKDAKVKLEKLIAEYNKKWDAEKKMRYQFTISDVVNMLQVRCNPWFFAVMKIDPTKYIKKIKSPVFTAIGEKDLQIYYKTNLAIIEQNLPKKTPRKVVSYPNLNHLFQTCETGAFIEYGRIEETIAPKVLEDILFWLNEVVHYENENESSSSKTVETAGITNKQWKLVELNGNPVNLPESSPVVYILMNSDGTVSGNLGCNSFTGLFTLQEGNRITFSQLVNTQKMCLDMSIETEMIRVLQSADNYNLTEKQLVLNRARMAPLARFEVTK